VDWLSGRVEVVDVMTRQGLRQWPNSKRRGSCGTPRRQWLVQDGVRP
jgi:hypothetical protein